MTPGPHSTPQWKQLHLHCPTAGPVQRDSLTLPEERGTFSAVGSTVFALIIMYSYLVPKYSMTQSIRTDSLCNYSPFYHCCVKVYCIQRPKTRVKNRAFQAGIQGKFREQLGAKCVLKTIYASASLYIYLKIYNIIRFGGASASRRLKLLPYYTFKSDKTTTLKQNRANTL